MKNITDYIQQWANTYKDDMQNNIIPRKIIVFFQCISACQNSGLISEEIIFIGIFESIVGNRF